MSREHHTYCEFQIGDSLIHLHFLRAMARRWPTHQFYHGVKPVHIPQMIEVVEDLPNIRLMSFEDRPAESILIWKNVGGFWERHALRNDYAGFHLDWFRHLAEKMSLGESPFQQASDLLFDYPALLRPTALEPWLSRQPLDFLVINSAPCSGQFRAYLSGPGGSYNPEYCDEMIARIADRYSVIVTAPTKVPDVPCTLDYGLTCTGIGHLSLFCKYLVMISTGPSWPTFNVWNRFHLKLRVALLDTETLNLAPNTVEVQTVDQALHELRKRGI